MADAPSTSTGHTMNLPVVGKVNQKTFFLVAVAGIGLVAYLVYRKAGASQQSNTGKAAKASGTGMVSHPNRRGRYHERFVVWG